jgi:hypothetical protein
VFERFSDGARRVVVLAQEEARLLNHNYIGTEHLLLGIVREGEGVAAQALESLEISLTDVRREVEDFIGRGEQVPSGHIPFTPRAKKVLELALREAMQLGHNYIGTEHILLGIIREGDGVAARTLIKLGAVLDRARAEVIDLLGAGAGEQTPSKVLSTSETDPELLRARAAAAAAAAAAGARTGALPEPRCSICGRAEARVDRIVAARGVLICDRCVRDVAAELEESDASGSASKRLRFRPRSEPPPDTAGAVLAIEWAFDAFFGLGGQSLDDAVAVIEDGGRLAGTVSAMREMRTSAVRRFPAVNDITVGQVRFLDEHEAEVTLEIWWAGSVAPFVQYGHAVLLEGTWKVSRATVCHFAGLGGIECPPPE